MLFTFIYILRLVKSSKRQVISVVVFHVLADPEHDRAVSRSVFLLGETGAFTYLNITNAFATTLATPNHSAGQDASCTTYFSTITVTPPAKPPAIAAKPMNRTTRAFHATPSPLYEKLSALKRDLSMLLMMIMPRPEKMPGIQSTKFMWKSEPLRWDFEKVAASMRTKRAIENYNAISITYVFLSRITARQALPYQRSSKVDPGRPSVGAVQPLRLWKPEQSMVRHDVC